MGRWKTIDDKTGKVRSEVETYEQGGRLVGKIVGLVIIRDLGPGSGRDKSGTILDPEDGKTYKAEVWVEDGKLKVRGYIGFLYRTQTWVKSREASGKGETMTVANTYTVGLGLAVLLVAASPAPANTFPSTRRRTWAWTRPHR